MERKWLTNCVQQEEIEGEGSLMDKKVSNGVRILTLVESLDEMEKFFANLLARKRNEEEKDERN